MRILIKVLAGILWSVFFLLGSAIVGALVADGLSTLLSAISPINPSSISKLTMTTSRLILILGTIAGFYLGYSRTLKKNAQDIGIKKKITKLVLLIIGLFIIGIIGYTLYINMRAYNRFGYYVYVSDEKVFDSTIHSKDPRILDHGRLLKDKIIGLDKKFDGGDGEKDGKVRWVECYGIDCDEGWESRSYK